MAFIDTHLHLIWRDRFGYSWTDGVPPLASGDFTLEDAAALGGDRVAGRIFMEVGVDDADYRPEARYVATLVGTQGLLGQIASCRPEEDAGFDAWLEECEGLEVVGFRRILHTVDDAMSEAEGFRANIRRIGAKGRVFDMCLRANQRHLGVKLARGGTEVSLVVAPCGVPDIAGGAFDSWRDGIDAIAEVDNVTLKLSGISAYAAPGTADGATLAPWIDHVIGAFGPGRILWGSDWPVVNLGTSMPAWIDICEAVLAKLSDDEAAAIAHGNAQRVYGVRL
ncbi:MAG: amidohydrolase family protein [Rubellimicrobium sp.]|nr:amidohydrolase family protein [Rubellimicrobium sp.]